MNKLDEPVELHQSSISKKQKQIDQRVKIATVSAAYNIALQIVLRIVTFVANAFILRYISKDILGVINVRLLLLYTTIQFTSREPFRRTCVPNSDESKNGQSVKWEHVVNLSFFSLPASIVIGLFFSMLWFTWLERPDDTIIPHYHYGIISIFMSVIIELLVEPFFIYGQRCDYIRLKVVIDGVFQLVRCLLLSAAVYISPRNAILGFAFAQLVASTVYSLCYVLFFIFTLKLPFSTFIPTYFRKNSQKQGFDYFDNSLWNTFWSFLKNSLLKQLLTEGERYIMTVFSVVNFAEQGIFDVINNLGSLPARLIFQQIEESGYLLFASLVNRDLSPSKQKEKILRSLNICSNLVKLMLLISMILFVYGFNCASLALFLYGGSNLVTGESGQLAVSLFKWHCIYIVFIACNGILEAYSFAAMSAEKINRFNLKMLILTIVFSVLSCFLVSLFGSQGFIVANCFNMAVRIAISLAFIGQLTPEMSISKFIRHSIPNVISLFSFIIIFVLLNYSVQFDFYKPNWLSIVTLIVVFAVTSLSHLVCLYFLESNLIVFCKTVLFSKSKSKTK